MIRTRRPVLAVSRCKPVSSPMAIVTAGKVGNDTVRTADDHILPIEAFWKDRLSRTQQEAPMLPLRNRRKRRICGGTFPKFIAFDERSLSESHWCGVVRVAGSGRHCTFHHARNECLLPDCGDGIVQAPKRPAKHPRRFHNYKGHWFHSTPFSLDSQVVCRFCGLAHGLRLVGPAELVSRPVYILARSLQGLVIFKSMTCSSRLVVVTYGCH